MSYGAAWRWLVACTGFWAVAACGSESAAPGAATPAAGAAGAGSVAGGGGASAGATPGGSAPGGTGPVAGSSSSGAGSGGGGNAPSGGAGGTSGGAGGGGSAGTPTSGGSGDLGGGPMGMAGGTFVKCDDHADFNGRGRCAATGNVGAVFAFENLTTGAALTTLTAVFGSTKPPSEAGCTEEAVGGCRVLTCPKTPAATTPGSAVGAITAKSSGGTMTTTPVAQGSYDVVKLGYALWSPMAALAISAAGPPAFGETFCGPPGVTFTAPAAAPSAALVVNRASDLALSWSGSNVGDVELVARDDSGASRVELQCFFTAESGQGSVPKAALGKLSAGAHLLASYTWVRKIGIAGGGACTELTAIMTNFGAGAVPFNGSATFQ